MGFSLGIDFIINIVVTTGILISRSKHDGKEVVFNLSGGSHTGTTVLMIVFGIIFAFHLIFCIARSSRIHSEEMAASKAFEERSGTLTEQEKELSKKIHEYKKNQEEKKEDHSENVVAPTPKPIQKIKLVNKLSNTKVNGVSPKMIYDVSEEGIRERLAGHSERDIRKLIRSNDPVYRSFKRKYNNGIKKQN